jgi:hypothetical protein
MSARRLLHWTVEYYCSISEPHACVVLQGRERHGLAPRRFISVAERVTLSIERDGPTTYQANQALVKRAMRTSSNRWQGRVP